MEVGLTFDDILLVPKKSSIQSRLDPDTSVKFLGMTYRSPFMASPMNCVTDSKFAKGLRELGWPGVIHRFQSVQEQLKGIGDPAPYWFAVGTGKEEYKRANLLHLAGANRFLIDTANGHTTLVESTIKRIKDHLGGVYIIAGNIATGEAAQDLKRWGADALRVGIGGGSACITRVVTGCGVPNLTAIQWVRYAATGLPIIIDGGIRNSGDIVKSIAFGADMVMLGYLLAPFSPAGRVVTHGTTKVKIYEGQASRIFQEEVRGGLKEGTAPEGVEHYVPMRYDMTAGQFLTELEGGLRSGMAYLNARSLKEIKAEVVKVTPASVIESYPRI